ncbi:MAG: helix-turn-helix transcriptional regulator [Lachnospiraceae bacterium]|nr:helix-turn-helix transcriptional regulator [Clostridiaceae bacterium]MCI9337030.1 helix-turn-helix transcriptional regulator [Lachnospiraceae bacterium]
MNDGKQNLATAVRDARTKLGLSQEKLAEILNIDSRTILNIETGRGNPKFNKLYPLITYLKIPADTIFYANTGNHHQPNIQKLFTELSDCTEQEADALFPFIHQLLNLLRKNA